jgi:hypothetical protein
LHLELSCFPLDMMSWRPICVPIQAAGKDRGVAFARIRDLYPHFEYTDLVKHKAVILIPYQVPMHSTGP